MRPGDTCAYIRTKTVSVEAYTPAGVQPIRRPAQPFGNDYRRVQQIHVRDTKGMRSEDRREATFMGLLGAATLAGCVVLTMNVVRSRPGGSARR